MYDLAQRGSKPNRDVAWDGLIPVYRNLLDLSASRYASRPDVAALVDEQRNLPTIASHRRWLTAFALPTD